MARSAAERIPDPQEDIDPAVESRSETPPQSPERPLRLLEGEAERELDSGEREVDAEVAQGSARVASAGAGPETQKKVDEGGKRARKKAREAKSQAKKEVEKAVKEEGEKVAGEFLDACRAETNGAAEERTRMMAYTERAAEYLQRQSKSGTARDVYKARLAYRDVLNNHWKACREVRRDDDLADSKAKLEKTRGRIKEERSKLNALLRRNGIPEFDPSRDQTEAWPGEQVAEASQGPSLEVEGAQAAAPFEARLETLETRRRERSFPVNVELHDLQNAALRAVKNLKEGAYSSLEEERKAAEDALDALDEYYERVFGPAAEQQPSLIAAEREAFRNETAERNQERDAMVAHAEEAAAAMRDAGNPDAARRIDDLKVAYRDAIHAHNQVCLDMAGTGTPARAAYAATLRGIEAAREALNEELTRGGRTEFVWPPQAETPEAPEPEEPADSGKPPEGEKPPEAEKPSEPTPEELAEMRAQMHAEAAELQRERRALTDFAMLNMERVPEDPESERERFAELKVLLGAAIANHERMCMLRAAGNNLDRAAYDESREALAAVREAFNSFLGTHGIEPFVLGPDDGRPASESAPKNEKTKDVFERAREVLEGDPHQIGREVRSRKEKLEQIQAWMRGLTGRDSRIRTPFREERLAGLILRGAELEDRLRRVGLARSASEQEQLLRDLKRDLDLWRGETRVVLGFVLQHGFEDRDAGGRPPEAPPSEADVVREFAEKPERERRTILRGILGMGYEVQELKCRMLGKICRGARVVLRGQPEGQRFVDRFLDSAIETFEKGRQSAQDEREELYRSGGALRGLKGIATGAGNITMWTRIIAGYGFPPATWVMRGAAAIGRGGEMMKNARFKSHKLIEGDFDAMGNELREGTRLDEDEAYEEAMRVYAAAQQWSGGEEVSAADLRNAYQETLSRHTLDRLEKDGPNGVAQRIARKHLRWSTEKIAAGVEFIDKNTFYTPEEKKRQKEALLKKHESFLNDLDRFVTRAGRVDMVAYASRLTEVYGRRVAIAMVLETLAEGAIHIAHAFYEADVAGAAGDAAPGGHAPDHGAGHAPDHATPGHETHAGAQSGEHAAPGGDHAPSPEIPPATEVLSHDPYAVTQEAMRGFGVSPEAWEAASGRTLAELAASSDPTDQAIVNHLLAMGNVPGVNYPLDSVPADMRGTITAWQYAEEISKRATDTVTSDPNAGHVSEQSLGRFLSMLGKQIEERVAGGGAGGGADVSVGADASAAAAGAAAEHAAAAASETMSHIPSLSFEVHSGDTVWELLEHRFQESGAFEGLSPDQREEFLSGAVAKLRELSPDQLHAMGFRSGDVDMIYPGEHIDLSSVLGDKSVIQEILQHSGAHEATEAAGTFDGADHTEAPVDGGGADAHAGGGVESGVPDAGDAAGADAGYEDAGAHGGHVENEAYAERHAADEDSARVRELRADAARDIREAGRFGSVSPEHLAGASEGNPFVRDWVAAHPGEPMSTDTYREFAELNVIREMIRPESLPAPEALERMAKMDAVTHELSAIGKVSLKEFMDKVPFTESPDADPQLWADVGHGVRSVGLEGAQYNERVTLTEDHLRLRAYLEEVPYIEKLGRVTVRQLSEVLKRRG